MPMHPLGKLGSPDHQQRDRQQGQQGQLPIEPEKHRHDPNQGEAGRNSLLQPVDENPLHMFGVVQDPRHDFAGGTIFEEADREPLQGRKHLHVQIVHDLLFQRIVHPDAHRTAQIAEQIGRHQPAEHPRQQLGAMGLNHLVDQHLDEPRGNQFEGRRQAGKEEGARHHRPVGTEVLKHAQKDFHRDGLFTAG